MVNYRKVIPGFILSLIVATISWYLGKVFNVIGGSVFAILIGMILSTIYKLPDRYIDGIKFTSKKILQFSIILLGFQMNLLDVLRIGGKSLSLTIITISSALITAYILYRMMKTPKKTSILIGVGTAICGGSAIAATAPVIGAEDEEVASAISTIFLYNILAILIFPPLGRILNMTDIGFGLWAGTAINDTSSVVAAGQIWGDEALQIATVVKMARTLFIIPITLILGIYTARKSNVTNKVSLVKIFPWFILGFLLASIITTSNFVSKDITSFLGQSGKFFIVVAMSAIGLNTNIKKLISSGKKPIFLGFCCWLVVAVVSIIVQRALNLL